MAQNDSVSQPAEENKIVFNKELLERAKRFSNDFIEHIDKSLVYYVGVLHRNPENRKNSATVNIVAAIASSIPIIGESIEKCITEGELYTINKINEKKAQKLGNLLYYYCDNKKEMQEILLKATIEIIWSFEFQLMKITTESSSMNAIHKLSVLAANKTLHYLIENKETYDDTIEITVDEIVKSVIESHKKTFLSKFYQQTISIDTIEYGMTKVPLKNIFEKCGLFSEQNKTAYKTEKSDTKIYYYRKMFEWEDNNNQNGDNGDSEISSGFTLTRAYLFEFCKKVKKHVTTKSPQVNTYLQECKESVEAIKDNHNQLMKYLQTNNIALTKYLENMQHSSVLKNNYGEIKGNINLGHNVSHAPIIAHIY